MDTLQQLWEYCQFCPICQKPCRDVVVSVGPDDNFRMIDYSKQDNLLHIRCDYYFEDTAQTEVTYIINCDTHKYELQMLDEGMPETQFPFYFYLNANCDCNNASISSIDIEIKWAEATCQIYERFLIDQEDIYLITGQEGYHITLRSNQSRMVVSKLIFSRTGGLIDDGVEQTYPFVNFDYTDIDKSIHKLKTIILFS